MSKMYRSFFTVSQSRAKILKNILETKRMSSVSDQMVVPKEDVVRFINECMCKVGATPESGEIVGHHLMTADYRGHFSHGMNRVPMYVKDIQNKITDPVAKPRIITDFQVRFNGK